MHVHVRIWKDFPMYVVSDSDNTIWKKNFYVATS